MEKKITGLKKRYTETPFVPCDPLTSEVKKESVVLSDNIFLYHYYNEIKAFNELSRTAQKIFLYLLQERDPITALSEFNYSKNIIDVKYKSTGTVYLALCMLIDKGFIAPAESKHHYWINPKYVFSGDSFIITQKYSKRN